MCMKHIQVLKETNIDLLIALKLSLLPDTCPSTGSPLLSPHCCLKQTSASIFMKQKGQTGGVSRLTVQLVGSALSVRCLGGQEKGLVVQIAVWGGRFVVRPEFSRAHVAAQGEQRLAQLPCNHRILEGAGSPGGKEGGEKKNTPGQMCFSVSPSPATSLCLYSLSLPCFSFLLLTHHSPSLSCSLPLQLSLLSEAGATPLILPAAAW